MEELVEDDICILNHEKADNSHKRDSDIPVSSYSGDESVASHFALVTAYEDIKKRLKETERENSLLKKRVRILEEKLLGSRREEECSSVGREQVNKAYQAYREACIDRDNLKSKLEKMVKESEESLKTLNEQLQSKEVELLQLKTEVETQQVMKSLNCTQANWELEKLNCDLKVHSLEQDLEKLKEECNSLRKELQKSKQKDQAQDENPLSGDHLQRQGIQSVQQAYWELKREMSNLRRVTDVQAEVLRKLKRNPTATNKAAPTAPVQCVESNISKLNLTSGVVYKNLSQNNKDFCNAVSPPLLRDVHIPSERVTLQAWADERPIPVDGKTFQEHHSYGKSSLEDNSWVFPSPPKPNENMFWEIKNNPTLLNCPADYLDQCNQNCLHKS
ncbi:5-azacytidine-induced protein 2 isoform X1 [Pipra filicauda]|uniref:5-azacytidine-induced protein 2 n=2 Tax=Pipra filicauda TaxID=649802 RepID=A0A6J2ISZ4_9PASS|nr:5-azacytidine-induced protein 2 isoform X1 [Pipra filicauda]XP_027603304.1 5-azacytidine-induced protein 2 isoform X1 [Pipra filicauda]XP_039237951.1 5-azacytidine-induced protein 2 isoform X1 [Pipra filicauda]